MFDYMQNIFINYYLILISIQNQYGFCFKFFYKFIFKNYFYILILLVIGSVVIFIIYKYLLNCNLENYFQNLLKFEK